MSNLKTERVGHWTEKAMVTHSSTPAWRIPGTEEPSGLPSMGSLRVGHDWSDLAAAAQGTGRVQGRKTVNFGYHSWHTLWVSNVSLPVPSLLPPGLVRWQTDLLNDTVQVNNISFNIFSRDYLHFKRRPWRPNIKEHISNRKWLPL